MLHIACPAFLTCKFSSFRDSEPESPHTQKHFCEVPRRFTDVADWANIFFLLLHSHPVPCLCSLSLYFTSCELFLKIFLLQPRTRKMSNISYVPECRSNTHFWPTKQIHLHLKSRNSKIPGFHLCLRILPVKSIV
jgi:hypothetical protein